MSEAVAALQSQFEQIWLVDFEYATDELLRPDPLCMVAREWKSGREIRMWRDELRAASRAPFDTGPESLFVAFAANAEMDCFLELGWPTPAKLLDLYVEQLAALNKRPEGVSCSLLATLAHYGLAHLAVEEKRTMREKAMTQTTWSPSDRMEMLDYCATDCDALAALLPEMLPGVAMPYALLRGRYMPAVSQMKRGGLPMDAPLYRQIVERLDEIKLHFIRRDGAPFGVYEGAAFRQHLFSNWLEEHNIGWPVTPEGRLDLKDATWRERARAHPELEPLRQLRTNITELRLHQLKIGADGVNRCDLWPFKSATGRNQPRASEFVFLLPGWLRGLIKPPEGYGFAYLDWKSQEIAIMAALSGDPVMIEAVQSGDPYLHFARRAGLAPADATKQSHKREREWCKVAVLGQNYGMTPHGLAAAIRVPLSTAREIHARHRSLHRVFHAWLDDMVVSAQFSGRMESVFGWPQRVDGDVRPRAIQNFYAQANGAEMLRLAVIAATEAGVSVAAPLHDALAIIAPLDELDDAIATTKRCMERAALAVTGGLPIEAEVETVVRWPDRCPSREKDGRDTWRQTLDVLGALHAAA